MTSRKFTPVSAPELPETKIATNIGIEPTLKSVALEWLAEMDSNLSEYVAESLEVHLVAAGRWKPRDKKPWTKPIPALLKKKAKE